VSVSVALMVTNVVLIEPAFQLPGFFRMAHIGQFRGEQSHVPSLDVVQALVLEAAVLIASRFPRRPRARQDRPTRRRAGVASL
jgi:hypothetical protein